MQSLTTSKSFISLFEDNQSLIISQWMQYPEISDILKRHGIKEVFFINTYANGIFEYLIGVIKGTVDIGNCPVMVKLLFYLKNNNISSQELFLICSHFKRSMIDIAYDKKISSKELFDEISYIFDKNFASVLAQYSQTIYEKDLEITKNATLLQQYIYAINESAIVSKTDEKGIITHVNDKFLQLCGFEQNELIGFSHRVIRDPQMPSSFFQDLWQNLHQGKVFRGTIKNRKKNGDYFYIDTTILPIQNPFTEKQEYIGVGYDVTKLIDAKVKAIDADRAKDYFLSSISHEIRTPLNAILGFVQILKDEIVAKRYKQYFDIIDDNGRNLLNIINDILDFSKLKSGTFTVERQVFNFEEILSRTIEPFVMLTKDKRIRLMNYTDSLMPSKISSDPLRIQQIVSNFISNAIKFTPQNGYIDIESKITQNNMLTVSVKDTGIGIDKKDIEGIFKPFSQVYGNGAVYGGTGLGLAICKQLATLLGGDIELSSKLSLGSKFTLKVPVQIIDKKPTLLECKLLQSKTIVFYAVETTDIKKLDVISSYLKQMGLKLRIVHSLNNIDYDLLYFFDEDMSDGLRDMIVTGDKPSICIFDIFQSKTTTLSNIRYLAYPLYLSKVRESLLDAFDLQKERDMMLLNQKQDTKHFDATVLIAEDNEANQELIGMLLSKYGISYDIAPDGKKAVELYKRKVYDLIFMDEQMPILNGSDTIKEILEIQKRFNFGYIPIVALTANVIKSSNITMLESSCDEFLGKPIDIHKLEDILIRYLPQKTTSCNMQILQEVLQLEQEQIKMLLKLYFTKADILISELPYLVKNINYIKLAKNVHSIKGSSANFRFKKIQNISSDIEQAANIQNKEFDYKNALKQLQYEYASVKKQYEPCLGDDYSI